MHAPSISKGIMLSFGSLLLLGIMPVVSNSRPAAVDALAFAVALSFWQTVFAGPVMAMEFRLGTRGIFAAALPRADAWRMAVVGLLTGALFGLSTYLYVEGVEKAGAANAAVAMQAYPLFAIILEFVFFRRRKTPLELFLTLLLTAALYYLGTGGTWRLSGLSFWFLVAVGVPLIWSIAHLIIKEELSRTPVTPAQVTFFRVAISTFFLVVVLAVTAFPAMADLPMAIMQPVSILMGLVYYLELMVWFYAIRHIDVSLASSITTPWPALTMVLAFVLLGDRIELYQVAALAVVVMCIYGLTLASLRKPVVAI